MRTPKIIYNKGIFMRFAVNGKEINYITFIWTHQGLKKEQTLSGTFNGDEEKLFEETRLKVLENPDTFGYDHTYWLAPKEEETYAELIKKDVLASQDMTREMLN